jgi:hypothetical protein
MILPLLRSSFEILVIGSARNDLQKVKSFDSNFAMCSRSFVLFILVFFFLGGFFEAI